MKTLDPDQVQAFLKAARQDRLYALYVVALDSGMRQGELFALAWPDIDLDGGSVRVVRSLEELNGELRVKDVKTARSRRKIDLSPFAVEVLTEHRRAMLAEGHIAGPVFCNSRGDYLRRSNLTRTSFGAILERARVPKIRFYDLRHTCATLLLLADVNAKVVSERLGHASVAFTLDVYSHVLPTMQKAAAAKLEGIFRPPVDGRKAAGGET
jgi:integrase